jgi:hypothetical protein
MDSVHGLVIGDTSDATSEITIATSTSGTGELNFTDTANTTNQGIVSYDHSNERMNFHMGASGTRWFIMENGGKFFTGGETSNANMTHGITISQGDADNEILAFKSSDVAHGMTTIAETDTFAGFLKAGATAGGIKIRGLGDSATPGTGAIALEGINGGAADTAKTTSGYGIIDMLCGIKDGTGQQIPGANQNMVSIRDAAATARYLFDVEGSAYADVEWTTYDTYDDLSLISDMEDTLLAMEAPDQTPRRHVMEATGIIGQDSWHIENGKPKAMVNFTKLAMLHHGALIQTGDRFAVLEERLALTESKLELAEAKLQLLEN